MSYRELRSFSETMRLLGYPNLISMESFRTPNVEMVADCLYWLIRRYEPSAEVVYSIEREADRVSFFKQICEVALTKGHLKLNIKKLYQSDGHAVQEMLKLATLLKRAMKATEEEEIDFTALQQMAAQKNVNDAKTVQQLCTELTSGGSTLFFLIEEEGTNRVTRQRVLSRATEVGEFERRLRELLTSVSQQVEQLQQSITNLNADETNLEQKIENKKVQLERAQKRYKSLMAVRPAFVEEYDKHEAELHEQFVKYLEQYRNLEYLEYQLAKFNQKEDAMLEEQETKLRVMRERLRKEELKTLRAQPDAAADDDDDDDDDDGEDLVPQARSSVVKTNTRNAIVEGSSEDDSDADLAPPARPQNAQGRHRPGPSGARDDDDDDSDSSDEQPMNVIAGMRKMRVGSNASTGSTGASSPVGAAARSSNAGSTTAAKPASGTGRPPAGAGAKNSMANDDDSEDTSDMSSDISTDDDDDDDLSSDSDI